MQKATLFVIIFLVIIVVAISSFVFRPPVKPLPFCTSDRSACFDYVNKCDPTGWECGANDVWNKTMDLAYVIP